MLCFEVIAVFFEQILHLDAFYPREGLRFQNGIQRSLLGVPPDQLLPYSIQITVVSLAQLP